MTSDNLERRILRDLTDQQAAAVTSSARRLLVVAGAGSGKTEVMARRIAWWLGVKGVSKDKVVAFTFTEKAAEEMKFRIRKWMDVITPSGEDATIGRMYIGTIHGFCLQSLQDLLPDVYGVYDIVDETGRLALVQRWFNTVLGMQSLRSALGAGQFDTIRRFFVGYDLLHECGLFQPTGPTSHPPSIGIDERDWIKEWQLASDVGSDDVSRAFSLSAGRYYGALRARRLLDFSTAQSELVRLLSAQDSLLALLKQRFDHVVVDEFQDVNPVQNHLIELLLGEGGTLTCVGDHRQAIFGWRGGRVEIMAEWHSTLSEDGDGDTLELQDNFRSTGRVIDLANQWARTITPLGSLGTPDMTKGGEHRQDYDPSHVAFRRFDDRDAEAQWIATTISSLVDEEHGVRHDVTESQDRGIGLSDIAILVRSATDVRTYMQALEARGIPTVVQAGPDLFRRPEVVTLLASLCMAAGVQRFFEGRPPTMASIAREDFGCRAEPEPLLRAGAARLQRAGVPVEDEDVERIVVAAELMHRRLNGDACDRSTVEQLKTPELRTWLNDGRRLRRIYPQTLFQWLAAEAGVASWDADQSARSRTAMFHLGQLSALITGIETPGWVTPSEFKWQVVALMNWGTRNARSDEAPLLVAPDAVTISTIHKAKGLEFPVVFLADVAARRFPSQRARSAPDLPFSGPAATKIDPGSLADNDNYDAERRLMYVALTRSERYLFISTGSAQRSRFERELGPLIDAAGGALNPADQPSFPAYLSSQSNPSFRLVTSFSDLRYYLECPHDYYLRKVLGFAPTIDQAFGYGRGVHNLMRAIHSDPSYFAELVADPDALVAEAKRLIDEGLFYLRYTTGNPLDNMKKRAARLIVEYVHRYRDELASLEFEPERAFETLIEEAGVLVSGAIDVIRHDDPPRVTLIDFKSGRPVAGAEYSSGLDREQMQLQVSLYGLAAKAELEYEPDLGLVRYLGGNIGTADSELAVPLDAGALQEARNKVLGVAEGIGSREFWEGPRRSPGSAQHDIRCEKCDFLLVCGRPEAARVRGDESAP